MTTYTRDASIEVAPLQEETILLDPGQNRFCLLNRTATFIWNQLGTPLTTETSPRKSSRIFPALL
jgi:hypothetical protein